MPMQEGTKMNFQPHVLNISHHIYFNMICLLISLLAQSQFNQGQFLDQAMIARMIASNLGRASSFNQGFIVNKTCWGFSTSMKIQIDSSKRLPILTKTVNQKLFKPYFQQQFKKINQPAKVLIEEIGKFRHSVQKQEKILQKYFQSHNSFLQHQYQDIFGILVAINMHGNKKLLKYRQDVFEYLLRIDTSKIEISEVSMHCLIDSFKSIQNSMINKRKLENLKHFFYTTLKNNIKKVHIEYYSFLINTLNRQDNKLFLSSVAYLFIEQIVNLMDKVLRRKEEIDQNVLFILRSSTFSKRFMTLVKEYNCPFQSFNTIYQYYNQHIFTESSTSSDFQHLIEIYRQFPVRQRNQKGEFYKRMFLNKMIKYLSKINFVYDTIYRPSYHFFFSTVIHQIFYEHWMNLEFCQNSDKFIYLEKQQLKTPPVMPPFFWQIYAEHHRNINFFKVTRDTIRDCYPSRYIQSKNQQYKQTKEPYIESQMRIRMELVLLKLGLKYKKEECVSSRYIDFLLEDNIIIEIDGMHHFQNYYFQNDDITVYRNLHLLLAGYKIIIMSIHEYNQNREISDLINLLTKKLNLMKEVDAAAVL